MKPGGGGGIDAPAETKSLFSSAIIATSKQNGISHHDWASSVCQLQLRNQITHQKITAILSKLDTREEQVKYVKACSLETQMV